MVSLLPRSLAKELEESLAFSEGSSMPLMVPRVLRRLGDLASRVINNVAIVIPTCNPN